MKNMIQKVLLSGAGLAFVAHTQFVRAIDIIAPVDPKIIGNPETADIAIQKLIGTAAWFLGILAVIYALYGGFNILTAGGAEDKVKKGKAILIQALTWLVVIWLANSIVQWLILKVLNASA